LQKNPRKFPWLPALGFVLLVALIAAVAGFFWISRNLAPVTRWALKKSLPAASVDVGEVKLGGPGEIVFENLTLRDPSSGKDLVRLERGKVVFAFEDIAKRQIGEIHLENPLLVISPGWSGVFPETTGEAKKQKPARVRRIVCDYGEIRYEGSKDGRPDIHSKFQIDWKNPAPDSDTPLELVLWDLRATAPGFHDPFLVLDLAKLRAVPRDLFKNFEIDSITLRGGSLAIGSALDQLTHLPKPSNKGPAPDWRVGRLEISDIQASLGDNAWRTDFDTTFTIATTLQNLTPSEISGQLGSTLQVVEFTDIAIPSPRDPFTRVLTLRSVFVRFTIADLLDKKIREATLLYPVVHIGEDLFLFMDRQRSRLQSGAPADSPGWKIERLEVKFGSLRVGSGGRTDYGLPLNFQTLAENVSFDDLATLTLSGSLEIPARTYRFPAYQLEFTTGRGDLRFSYPPEKGVSNVVGTVKLENIRWRQFQSPDAWITTTFDRTGVNGLFGGTLLDGIMAGGFSFFFLGKSPWIGWLSGTGLDLGALTDILAPQNFRLTGPLDFAVETNAEAKKIRRVKGSFETTKPGSMQIGKIDDLLARIPPEWSSIKQDTTRIALESLRDFDFDTAGGGFWFADGEGLLDLALQGPLGSRKFQTALHNDSAQ